jgi:predicted PurR-regulated permease PerM
MAIDIHQYEYLAGIVAAFIVIFIYAIAFFLLRFLANILIAAIIIICAAIPFSLLHSGTISSISELLSISALAGILCASLCTVIYPYSTIYEKKLQERLGKE